jgi:two-component system sensor histidine kinase BaeS
VRGSLRTRLFAASGLVVVCSVGLTLGLGAVLTRRQVERATIADVAHQADLLAERERGALVPCGHLVSLQSSLARRHENVECPLARSPDVRGLAGKDGVLDGSYYAARRVGNRILLLWRTQGISWRPYLWTLVVAALAGVALAALVSLWLARRLARPVVRVADAARSLAWGDSPKPVPVEGGGELAQLATSFNEMSEQLARARAAEQQFLLSVSHELKTPLTAIRGYAEAIGEQAVGPEEAAATIALEADRLERLVRDLLDLARMRKSEFAVHVEELDLAETAQDVVRRLEPQARLCGVRLEADAPAPAPALGDVDRVLQAASNLVENALRLTPAGGSVTVRARPGELAVEDTGPGLRAEELARAFERFYLYSRYRGERPVGTGLGLAIVKELAQAMHGGVEVASELGRGTRFTLRLPSAPARERELVAG